MKSLEFANEYRNITVKSMNEYIDNCDKYGQEINECYFNMLEEQLAHFDIIKQDLEVLEIIRKKNVDIKLLKLYYNISLKVEDWLDTYNSTIKFDKHKLTMEELLKLKQWLETNKVGDSND